MHATQPAQSSGPSVTLIGLGNWGTALAHALHQAHIPIHEIVMRDIQKKANPSRAASRTFSARVATLANARLSSDVVWICSPDATILELADRLAALLATRVPRKLPVIFHSSGALPSTILAPLQNLGASVAAVHPLMTFPPTARKTVKKPMPLTGVPFAIEGDAKASRIARKLVRALGAEPFSLSPEGKPLYHAFGAFASPLLVTLLQAAVETAAGVGYTPVQARARMRPIVEQTVANFFENGPDDSFSGPIARGDTTTIERHLKALRHSPTLPLYKELSIFALRTLPAENKKQIKYLLLSPNKNLHKKRAPQRHRQASTA